MVSPRRPISLTVWLAWFGACSPAETLTGGSSEVATTTTVGASTGASPSTTTFPTTDPDATTHAQPTSEATTGGTTEAVASTTGSDSETTTDTTTDTTITTDPDTDTTANSSGGVDYDFADPDPLEDQPLAPGWSCSAFVHMNDIWLRTSRDGQQQFDLRIGAGGAIAELRDIPANYAPLLSPPFKGEVTDRVIQWTLWSPSVVHQIANLPQFEWRFNVTQAGTFNNTIAPTHFVVVDPGNCRIDAYVSPRDQWKTEQQPHMQGTFAARIRYDVIGPGHIVVRRTLRIGDVTLSGNPAELSEVYFEGWTPLRRPTFDALAVVLDAAGAPSWWYKAGENLPHYPFIDVATTEGYGVGFRSDALGATAVGLAFGTAPPCRYVGGECLDIGAYALNSMDWGTGLAVLPGLSLVDLQPGQLLDQYVVLAPTHGLTTTYAADLRTAAQAIPPPRVLDADAVLPADWVELAATLATLPGQDGTRTDHLAPLIE